MTDTDSLSKAIPLNPKYDNGPNKLKRNEHGLLENVEYHYDAVGYIDWKRMINPKFFFPNKDWFAKANKPVPESAEGLEDHQIICKLGGYKELARLRGYSNVEYKLEYLENGVSCICTITWIPNYEIVHRGGFLSGGFVKFSSIANSTSENCGPFMEAFKETQAENRAFVRCVRNFLNVNIVGDDEMNKGKTEVEPEKDNSPNALNPQKNLEDQAAKKGFKTYESLKTFLLSKNFTAKEKQKTSWMGFSDIPPNECARIISLLKD